MRILGQWQPAQEKEPKPGKPGTMGGASSFSSKSSPHRHPPAWSQDERGVGQAGRSTRAMETEMPTTKAWTVRKRSEVGTKKGE